MKIRTRIILTIVITSVISFLILGYLIVHYSLEESKRVIYAYLSDSGRARAEHIITFIDEKKKTSDLLAAVSIYRDFLKEPETSDAYQGIKKKIDARLAGTLQVDEQIDEAFIIDKNGKLVASTDKSQEGLDKSQDEYFTQAQEGAYFKDIYLSPVKKILSYTISSPIIDSDGSFLGVSVLRYLPSSLFSIVNNENGLGETEENFLINHDKFLLTPTKFLNEGYILKKQIETKNAESCFNQTEVDYVIKNGYSGLTDLVGHTDAVEAKDYREVDVIATHTYIPGEDWCLITKVDKADALKKQYALLADFWFYVVVSMVIFSGIIILSINNIIKSILIFVEATKRYKEGDFGYRIKIKSQDEIGELGQSFNSMAAAAAESKEKIEEKVAEQVKEISKVSKDLLEQKTAILNVLEDVDAEKKRTEKLAKDLEKFELAVANASDHIVITDQNGMIIFANHAMEEITGFSPAEVIGKKVGNKELWGGEMDQVFYEKMWKTIKVDKESFVGEINNHRKNGEKYIAHASITPILDHSGEVEFFVAIERDITKEKMVDKAKSEFVSLASHQLRTPLSAIKWTLEALEQDHGLTTKHQERIKDVYDSNERLINLVNDLLNVSHIEDGKVVLKKESVDIAKLVKDSLKTLEVNASKKKQTLKLSVDTAITPTTIDVLRFGEAFNNLVSNAINYAPEGQQISITLSTKDNNYLVAIHNDEPVIPLVDQKKLFTKFYRGTNIQIVNTTGSGLGLFIAKAAVEENGGKIWFESAEGKGTTFFFTVPKK